VKRYGCGTLLALWIVALAAPASAAWLVLRDGRSIATSGPWQIGNNRVTYLQPDGRRINVMLVVVNPEATRLANVPGAPPPPAQDTQHKRIVISNESVKKNKSTGMVHDHTSSPEDIGAVLTTIAECLTRFPNSAADYGRCCAAPR
jgi:hypothetical protein